MVYRIISTTSVTSNTSGVELRLDDSAYIAANVLVGSLFVNGVNGDGNNHSVTMMGAAIGSVGIYLGSGAGNFGQYLYIGAQGDVTGRSVGAYLAGRSSQVENFGNVHSQFTGMTFQTGTIGTSSLANHGVISGGTQGITHTSIADDVLVVRNWGTITAPAAFQSLSSSGIDQVINHGFIIGTIELGGGADLYDGRGGTVDGIIYGGEGADIFRPGAGAEVIDGGGSSSDMLDFRGTRAVNVALDGSFANAGSALGDTYTGIENITGSSANDILSGDAGQNLLNGAGGVDRLLGRSGEDVLQGGGRADILAGGAGNDAFLFMSLTDCGDLISDFSHAIGNTDRITISSSGFGDLSPDTFSESQFRSRADNLAQDADDRFIFRSTDKTLWFDANGNWLGGLTLVVDLQANATLTFNDIFLL